MPASVEFYEKLGFSVESRNDEWGWAMLRYGEYRLMVDQSITLHPGIPRISVIYLYPENGLGLIFPRTSWRPGCLWRARRIFNRTSSFLLNEQLSACRLLSNSSFKPTPPRGAA